MIIIHSEGVGGALCTRKILDDVSDSELHRKTLDSVRIVALETLAYACKVLVDTDDGTVTSLLKRQKNNMHVTGIPLLTLDENRREIAPFLSPTELRTCRDPLEVGINDTPAFHVIGMLGNAERIVRVGLGREDPFNFYMNITPEMTDRMERLDAERAQVGLRLGQRRPTDSREFLNISYDIALTDRDGRPRSLYDMIQDPMTPYHGAPEVSLAPDTLGHRYVTEEIPTRIVPLWSLGKALGMEMPVHKGVIDEVWARGFKHLIREGRNIETMGLSPDDVHNWQDTMKRF